MRSVSSIAIVLSLFLLAGCGNSGKITMAPEGSEAIQDAKYATSLSGLDIVNSFGQFLESCSPADRANYIKRSTTDYTAYMTFRLKPVYERYSHDASAEVAEAAKEALEKSPENEEAAQRLMKQQIEEKSKD